MDNIYKPFKGYSFYLDLSNCPLIRNQLTKYINTLGGRIDEFLNKNVKYIVTNRPKNIWPNRETVIRNKNIDCDQLMANSPIGKSNSNKGDLFSRGKLLLSKAVPNIVSNGQTCVQKITQTTDVLELGRIWNIKIIQSSDMLDFCRKHLNPSLSTSPPKEIIITELKSPFVKIEDKTMKNRANYKELQEWPSINFENDPDFCPFIRRRIQRGLTEPNSLEGLAISYKLNTNNEDNDEKTKDKSLKTSLKQMSVRRKVTTKRRTPHYCEICLIEYEDFSKHIKSETHVYYTQNQENYKELLGVISSLPPFKSKCMQTNVIESESDEELHSPFQSTPPTLPTKFQFTGSKHKSHFLSLHDLIQNKFKPNEVILEERHETNCDTSHDLIIPSVSSVITHSKQVYSNCLNHNQSEEF